MKAIPWRVQIAAVAVSYLTVLLMAAALVYLRYLQYAKHPEDARQYGAMYAFGDWLLALFIGGLFLVPTFLLILVIRTSEAAYTRYSQVLLVLGATAPICLGLFFVPAVNQGNSWVGEVCIYRLLTSPVAVVGMIASRLFARFRQAKRLTAYALLLEVGTIALLMAMVLLPGRL